MSTNGPANLAVRLDSATSTIMLEGRGFLTIQAAADCEQQLERVLPSLKIGAWRMLLDFTGLRPQTPDVQDALQRVFHELIAKKPERVSAATDNTVAMLQLKRLWVLAGGARLQFCPSREEARAALRA